jgi:hypothetical protein
MYSGGQKSRDIIRDYEMYGNSDKLACHVLLATYEAVINVRDFSRIFKGIPRWEVVVVDEGQRCKSYISESFISLSKDGLNSKIRHQSVVQAVEGTELHSPGADDWDPYKQQHRRAFQSNEFFGSRSME